MGIRSNNPDKLKLPRLMPDGRMTAKHPLLWCLANRMRQNDDKPDKKVRLAEFMGVAPQSLYKWERECEADRNFSVPAERAAQMARYFNVSPTLFRPDLYTGE
jgi:DNA-binding XRE family transcriptional regulator